MASQFSEEKSQAEPFIDVTDITLPGHLDDSCPFTFDHRPASNTPCSPMSPGKRSPGRPWTMKEYEEELKSLRSENYNLKLRIFFIEQNRIDLNLPKDVEELRKQLTDLKVDFESKKKELSNFEDLLLKSYKVLDTQKKQLEAIKSDHDSEKQTLLNKICCLEKELRDYHTKFMETSIHLDDTNALYAMTFGLGSKQGTEKIDDSNEKITELENYLVKEKEKIKILQDENTQLKSKLIRNQDELKKLQCFIEGINRDLDKISTEKNYFEETANEVSSKLADVENNMKNMCEALKQKESEIEQLKTRLKEKEERIADTSLHEEKPPSDAHRKILKLLTSENKHLKEQIQEVQTQLETSNGSRSSRERSIERQKELHRQLRSSEQRRAELQKEIHHLKSVHENGQALIQALIKENKTLKRGLDGSKTSRSHTSSQANSSKEEDRRIDEFVEKMTSEKDDLISELYCKIEELTKALKDEERQVEDLKKLGTSSQSNSSTNSKTCSDLKADSVKQEKEIEELTRELGEKKKEVENLKRELKKKTFNLQGLVNTELWNKNREIEKLNKVCDRKHLEVLALKKELRDYQKTMSQNEGSFVSNFSLQNGLFTEDKENLQPVVDPLSQVQQLNEEKRLLTRKIEELQARLLNTPERDTDSLLIQTLRNERDQAEKLRKEAVNACLLLTTRLQELADFLDSLLPTLCGKKRRVVQQAVERSRELSRSLSLAAEDSSVLQCSAWTDLQPSLYVPLLPDISTVDFWSGEEEEAFSGGQEVNRLKSQVETLTEEIKFKDGEIARFQSEKQSSDSSFLKSMFGYRDQNFLDNVESNFLLNDMTASIAEITEGSLVNSLSDQPMSDKTQSTKLSPEIKSTNIGRITVSSKKKDSITSHNLITFEDKSITNDNERCMSEYETWSEPDRDVSFARMGLKENSTNVNKSLQCKFNETSETADFTPKSPSPRRASEVQRLQRKINGLEQVNEALRSELLILHQLTPTASSRQDKSTSIEFSRQSMSSVPSHLLEEIKIQREKLEASLFHNDYIRRQLESTVLTLRKSQEDDQEKTSILKLKDVSKQLDQVTSEMSALKLEKEEWGRQSDQLQSSLQQQTNELLAKQCALLEANERLKKVEETNKEKCSKIEERCAFLENKLSDLQQDKENLMSQISNSSQEVTKLTAEVQNYKHEGKKDKQTIEELNNKVQQLSQKREDLQRVISEQEQLMADAERERQELATQLIARDRQVSELQKHLSRVEQASCELEAALRSQLDCATHQCAQFEAKIRELDSTCKRREEETVSELRRRLDAARFAHSEAVLQYTRLANDNIRLRQQLQTRPLEPTNQMAQLERMKSELERRVVELEAVNAELETRLGSLNVIRPLYSDCETDAASCVAGSPRRNAPPNLTLPISPHRTAPGYSTQQSQDLTSDYLSDQDGALSSPQVQTRNVWSPTSPLNHMSTSPDLGIESDHGHFSSLDHAPRSTVVAKTYGAAPVDLLKLEEENTQLRRNLQKTRQALQETLSQLTSANNHKRQYEAQLSAANQHKAKVERAICRQIHKTHSILKKARVNLEEDGDCELH